MKSPPEKFCLQVRLFFFLFDQHDNLVARLDDAFGIFHVRIFETGINVEPCPHEIATIGRDVTFRSVWKDKADRRASREVEFFYQWHETGTVVSQTMHPDDGDLWIRAGIGLAVLQK